MTRVFCILDDHLSDVEASFEQDEYIQEIHKLNGSIGEVDISECGLDNFIYYYMSRLLSVNVNGKIYKIEKCGLKDFWFA